jgi:yeast amino acid transporter
MPYYGYFQPWCGYASVVFFTCVTGVYGYTSFKPWNTEAFFSCYAMVFVAIFTFTFWKIYKKTKFIKPQEADLVWERPVIDAYEASILTPPLTFWREMMQLLGIKRRKGGNDPHRASISV